MSIGPSEINNVVINHKYFGITVDSPETVEQYKKYVQEKPAGQFLNGSPMFHNILMMASYFGNVHLVRYIAENADPKILEMRDSTGRTALHHAVRSISSYKKVIECTRILLQAGANVHARCQFKKVYANGLLPSEEDVQDEDNYEGENAFGYLIDQLSNRTILWMPNEIKKYENMVDLFIKHGAQEGYVQSLNSFISADDEIKESDMDKKAIAVKVLCAARQRVIEQNWSKTRRLFLGMKSPQSLLNSLPTDLQKLLAMKTAM